MTESELIKKIEDIITEKEIYPVSNSLNNPRPNEQDFNKIHADKFKRIWKAVSEYESNKRKISYEEEEKQQMEKQEILVRI